jgi:CDP-glucose 4,6-dehydratase
LPVVVTRCSNLYGGADMNMSRIIPNTIRLALKGQSPIIWRGSETSIREFLYIEDAVEGYLALINNIKTTAGHAFNIGSKEIITIEEIVTNILEKMTMIISL